MTQRARRRHTKGHTKAQQRRRVSPFVQTRYGSGRRTVHMLWSCTRPPSISGWEHQHSSRMQQLRADVRTRKLSPPCGVGVCTGGSHTQSHHGHAVDHVPHVRPAEGRGVACCALRLRATRERTGSRVGVRRSGSSRHRAHRPVAERHLRGRGGPRQRAILGGRPRVRGKTPPAKPTLAPPPSESPDWIK